MTPSEHYTEAERLLSEAEKIAEGSPERADRLVARAQVHALLAGSRQSAAGATSRPNDGGFDNRGRHSPPSPPRLHDLYE